MKDDLKANTTGNGSGLSGFLGGWFRNGERTRSRSDLVDTFNDDSNESMRKLKKVKQLSGPNNVVTSGSDKKSNNRIL